MSDFFDSHAGLVDDAGRWRPRFVGRLRDALYEMGASIVGGRAKAAHLGAKAPVRRVLVVGVAHPDRPGDLERVVDRFRDSRHEVTSSIVPMQAGVGKFQNITRAIAQVGRPIEEFDWVVVTDDDVGLPEAFLDRFIALAEHGGLAIAQPAHRFFSYTTFAITQRRWGSLVRSTRWVEIGPITAFRRDTLADILPFPVSRWDWGLDVYWAQLAERKGWRVGIVDGAAVAHLRPVAGGYDSETAIAEAVEFLARYDVTITRAECQSGDHVVVDWWPETAPVAPRRRVPMDTRPSSGAQR